MKKINSRIFLLSIIIFSFIGIFGNNEIEIASSTEDTNPTSVILLIGDGMGPEQVKFGGLIEYGPTANSSILEFPYRTTISTNNLAEGTTDSAASATAIATGVKTTNGRISTNWDGRNLTTILEIAKENGYSTGVIAKSTLDHATPAGFIAHNEDRGNYLEISEEISRAEVDLLLGGGASDSHLGTMIEDMIDSGYSYVTNNTDLEASSSLPLLGIFAEDGLPNEKDRTIDSKVPTLLEMVQKGISLLNSTNKPFFLMVEGSEIDWAGHDNDKVYLGYEMIEFEKAVSYVKNLGEKNNSLQILVTADHETGGFSVKDYEFLTELPGESDDFATLMDKRLERINEIDVDWTTGGHTKTQVYLTGMGPYSEEISDAQHHVDTFSIMRLAIEGEIGPRGTGWYDGYNLQKNMWYIFGSLGIIAVIGLSALFIKKRRK